MRIGIDAQTVLNPAMGSAAGLGHYTYQLIKYLLKMDTENEYVIFVNYRAREKDLEKIKTLKKLSCDNTNIILVKYQLDYLEELDCHYYSNLTNL